MRRSAVCSAMLLLVLVLTAFATPSAPSASAPLAAAAAPAPAATESDAPPATALQDDAALQAVRYTQIAIGDGHYCALTHTGAVYCWGSNASGQLGNGTRTDSAMPVQVDGLSSGVRSISAGLWHTCALRDTGQVVCWGLNNNGQLGDNSTVDRWTPVPVSGLSNVTAIEAGGWHTCAVAAAGSAYCWGLNQSGQLGDGTTTTRRTPVLVRNLSNVRQIAAGQSHTCAVTATAAAYCWGENRFGELGDGTTNQRSTPGLVRGLSSGVADIAASGDDRASVSGHTCAVTTSGAVFCWGYGMEGQLGNGWPAFIQTTPVAVQGPTSPIASVTAGSGTTCALSRVNTVFCWGGGDGRDSQAYLLDNLGSNIVFVASSEAEYPMKTRTCVINFLGTGVCWYPREGNREARRISIPQPADGTYAISGRVADSNGYPISGATIRTNTGQQATSSANGDYTIQGVAAGEYWLTASHPDYNFKDSLRVVVSNQSVTGLNFTGYLPPIIFIPGIMGSYLDMGPCNIWPGHPRTMCPTLPSKQLLAMPETAVVATDAIRQIAGLPGGIDDVYLPLLEELGRPLNQGGLGLVEYRGNGSDLLTPLARCERAEAERRTDVTLFVFAYDWCQDNAAHALDLAHLIDCVRRIHGSVDVNILTHSMGGLIARKYITDRPNHHHVRKLVTIAAPWLGAPKALVVMETGWFDPKINALFEADVTKLVKIPGIVTLKLLAERFPSVHQLLPSRASIDMLGERPLREDGRNLNGWWPPNDREAFAYDQYIVWLDSHYLLSDPGSANQRFHTARQDDWRDDQSGVRYVHVYGRSDRHDTPRSLRAIWGIGCASRTAAKVICVRFPGWDVDWTWGDGTVPVVNARRCTLSATNPDECAASSANLNAPGSLIIPVTRELSSGSVEHTDLAKNAYVIRQVVNALRGSMTPALASTSATIAAMPMSAYYLDILGSGRITIADALGNTTDTISGTLTTPVPNVMYTPLTDLQHAVVLQATQSYTITFRSGDTPMLITVRCGTGDTADAATRFLDVSVPPGTQLQLRITPQGVEPLRADTDGDGTFETEVPPTASVTGAAANDLDAPTVTISATGPLDAKTVTITATDGGAGVKQLLYSLDGTTFQPYTAPFVVDATQTPVVYAFADDNVANRSSLVTWRLAWPTYLPLTVR